MLIPLCHLILAFSAASSSFFFSFASLAASFAASAAIFAASACSFANRFRLAFSMFSCSSHWAYKRNIDSNRIGEGRLWLGKVEVEVE